MAYASKYYDPAKAHEYYERTKVLKGYENRYGGSRGNGTSVASSGYTGSSKSSNITDGNGKSLTATQAHNMKIKQQVAGLRQQLSSMSAKDRKANREAINDQIQKLREQIKGGSTSGFNRKGIEAAAYIKNQMEKERDNIISKSNKMADKEMLSKVTKLQSDIEAMRKSGRGFSHKEFKARIKAMLGETKKIKAKTKRKLTKDYAQRYKDEIDKLRGDTSMYSYYDQKLNVKK